MNPIFAHPVVELTGTILHPNAAVQSMLSGLDDGTPTPEAHPQARASEDPLHNPLVPTQAAVPGGVMPDNRDVQRLARDLVPHPIPDPSPQLNIRPGWQPAVLDAKRLAQLGPQSDTRCVVLVGPVSVEQLATLKQYRSVRWLHLQAVVALTDRHLEVVADFPNLTAIRLTRCTGISDQGLAHLKKLQNLITLDLTGCTGISGAGLARTLARSNSAGLLAGSNPKVVEFSAQTRHLASVVERFPNIAGLSVSGEIGPEHIEMLDDLAALRRLNLAQCNIRQGERHAVQHALEIRVGRFSVNI